VVWGAIDIKLIRNVAIKILESFAPIPPGLPRSAGAGVAESSSIAAIFGVEERALVPNLAVQEMLCVSP
jgi:hypothetical protein